MMNLEPVSKVIMREECFRRRNELFDVDRFKRFVNVFNVKSTEYGRDMLITPEFFSRWISAYGTQARKHKADYWGENNFEYRFEKTGHFGHLFDHIDAHKTGGGYHFITSMPYSTPELSINAFNDLKRAFPYSMEDINMYFLPHEYKFRKNGDFMLLFCRCDSEPEDVLELRNMTNCIPEKPDKWNREVK